MSSLSPSSKGAQAWSRIQLTQCHEYLIEGIAYNIDMMLDRGKSWEYYDNAYSSPYFILGLKQGESKHNPEGYGNQLTNYLALITSLPTKSRDKVVELFSESITTVLDRQADTLLKDSKITATSLFLPVAQWIIGRRKIAQPKSALRLWKKLETLFLSTYSIPSQLPLPDLSLSPHERVNCPRRRCKLCVEVSRFLVSKDQWNLRLTSERGNGDHLDGILDTLRRPPRIARGWGDDLELTVVHDRTGMTTTIEKADMIEYQRRKKEVKAATRQRKKFFKKLGIKVSYKTGNLKGSIKWTEAPTSITPISTGPTETVLPQHLEATISQVESELPEVTLTKP